MEIVAHSGGGQSQRKTLVADCGDLDPREHRQAEVPELAGMNLEGVALVNGILFDAGGRFAVAGEQLAHRDLGRCAHVLDDAVVELAFDLAGPDHGVLLGVEALVHGGQAAPPNEGVPLVVALVEGCHRQSPMI